jgi:hypothetical protein
MFDEIEQEKVGWSRDRSGLLEIMAVNLVGQKVGIAPV